MNIISRYAYNHIGILNYQPKAIPRVIINRITRKLFGGVFCSCGQFVRMRLKDYKNHISKRECMNYWRIKHEKL